MKINRKYNPEILKTLRTKKRKLTLEGALKLMYSEVGLDITRPTLSSWENGKTRPDIKNLPALCVFYDISITELVTLFFGIKTRQVALPSADGHSKAVR